MDHLPMPRVGELRRLLLAAIVALGACSKEPVEIAPTVYPADAPHACAGKAVPVNTDDGESTTGGIRYFVRVPANYEPSIAHPLIIVYPGAGQSGTDSERHTGLTPAATAAGFIVAYADHRRLSLPVLDELATIPDAIVAKWCVDPARIYVTGHSDGGTAAAAMAFRDDDGFTPAAIAPSAAGLTAEDLGAYACPEALPVLVLHSNNDKLFPGFGRSAVQWWAACNGCESATESTADGCIAFAGCPVDTPVKFCAGEGSHRRWPARNSTLLTFFSDASSSR